SQEIQQSWCRQIEPVAHASCTPSVWQTNVAPWLGMQPFSVHTSLGLGHMPMFERGTQAPPTHTSMALLQSLVTAHPCCGTVQMPPWVVSQLKPSRQSVLLVQPRTHLPDTHFSLGPHCEPSKHWLAAGVHTPPLPSLPAMQRLPDMQS